MADIDTDPPGDAFYYRKPAESTVEAVSENPRGRQVSVTKAVIQKYISDWMTPDTAKRRLLEQFSPSSANFVLNRPSDRSIHIETGFSWEDEDPTQRRVQVARFMTKLKERYPAVLIVDGGFRNRSAGLGDIQGARIVTGQIVNYDLVCAMVISLEIIVAALDPDTCSNLAVFLSHILGSPLRRFGGGNMLTAKDDNTSYQITFPLENSFGALSRENITEDQVDSKWSCTCSLEIDFESIGTIRSSLPIRLGDTNLGDPGGSSGIGRPGSLGSGVRPLLVGPTSIKISQGFAQYDVTDPEGHACVISDNWAVSISDRRVAQLHLLSGIVLRPARPGTVELRISDRRRTEQDAEGIERPLVLARLSITVG